MTPYGPTRDELADALPAGLPPAYATKVAEILATARLATGPDPLARDTGAHLRLRRLAEALPPAAEVFADRPLLARLSAATALADPPLYQTFLSHYVLCGGSLALLGGPGADPAGELDHAWAKGSFLVTELGDASSHLGIRTTAAFDPVTREFVLHTPDERAVKFSSLAALGLPQKAVVCARLLVAGQDGGVFSFLADITDDTGEVVPGVELSSPLSADALPLPYSAVRFHHQRLPFERWLSDSATIGADGVLHDPCGGQDARLQRTLSVGQALWATLPAAMAAMAARSAVLAWRYSAARRSHGRLAPGAPVLAYRTQQHAVVGALAEAFVLACTADAALSTWASDSGTGSGLAQPAPDVMAFSPWAAVDRTLALCKALTTRSTARLIDACQHRSGVSGLLDVNRLTGYLGFARAFDNAGGDNILILLDAGRALAEQPSAEQPSAEQLPPADPSDPRWWPRTLVLLQRSLTAELRGALRTSAADGAQGLELWNPLLEQALQLGGVQAELIAAEAATRTLAAAAPAAQPVLGALAALHGLGQAQRLSGALLCAGLLDPATYRRLPALLDGLCDQLAPHLPAIAQALDRYPDPAPVPMDSPDYAAALAASLHWNGGTA
jgi:acyl-CoA oxidase